MFGKPEGSFDIRKYINNLILVRVTFMFKYSDVSLEFQFSKILPDLCWPSLDPATDCFDGWKTETFRSACIDKSN